MNITSEAELADYLINRLNEIASHDRIALAALIEQRVPCNASLADHPTVQVSIDPNDPMKQAKVGLLGILNGIVGSINKQGSSVDGYGYISAYYDDDTQSLVRFQRTKE